MAIELGAAYISILPETSKLADGIKGTLKDSEKYAGTSGKSMGSNLAGGLMTGAKRIVGGLGLAGALVGGMALKGGISRLLDIDTAQGKMRGLGMTAKQISTTMDSALGAVKGTAFGLADAVTLSVGALAAGIKNGNKLQGYLSTVADTATLAGADLNDVGMVFNQIMSTGTVHTGDLLQLAQRGIPIFKWLADSMHMSMDELQKALSLGLVKSNQFLKAITANTKGAALKSGDTIRGSFMNLKASLGRIGANFLEGIGFGNLNHVFMNITTALGPVETMAGKVGDTLGILGRRFGGWVQQMFPLAKLKASLSATKKLITDFFKGLSGDNTQIIKAGSLFPGGPDRLVKQALPQSAASKMGAQIREMFSNAFSGGIKNIDWKSLGDSIGTGLASALNGLGKLAGKLFDAFDSIMAKIDWVGIGIDIGKQAPSLIIGLAAGLMNFDLMGLLKGLAAHWQDVLFAIIGLAFTPGKIVGKLGEVLARIPLVGKILEWLLLKAKSLSDGIFKFVIDHILKPFGKAFASIFPETSSMVGGLVKNIVTQFKLLPTRVGVFFLDMGERAVKAIEWLARAAGKLVGHVIRVIFWPLRQGISVFAKLWNAQWRLIGRILSWVWEHAVKPVFNTIKTFLQRTLGPVFKWLWTKVIQPVWRSIGNAISTAWTKVIKPVFTALHDFIGNKLVPAFKSGVNKIGDIWNGLKAAARKPVEFLVNTVYNNGIRNMMNKIPGVNLPSAHFAQGGVLPGYTPGKDVHHFFSPTGGRLALSGGEAIMRPEFTKMVGGKKGVEFLNRFARRRKDQKFARGGVYNPLPGSHWGTYPGHDGIDLNVGSGWDDYGLPIHAFRSGHIDYVGWGRGYGQAIFEGGPWGEVVYGHTSRVAVNAGQNVRGGQVIGYVGSTGNSSAPHLHFGVPGGTAEMALALLHGAVNVGAKAARPNPGEAKKSSILDAIKSLPSMAKSVWNGISGMGSKFGPWGDEFKKAGVAAIRDAITWADNKIPNKIVVPHFPDVPLPDNPIRDALKAIGIFDNGGVLEPGKFAYNASNKPEAVFNHKQFKSFAQERRAERPRRTEFVITNWQTGEGYFREIARDEVDANDDYTTTIGRMSR